MFIYYNNLGSFKIVEILNNLFNFIIPVILLSNILDTISYKIQFLHVNIIIILT